MVSISPAIESNERDPQIGPAVSDRCPVCNARQKPRDVKSAEVVCRRCGCDLGVAFAIVEQARGCFEYSMLCAAKGEIHLAISFIDKALGLYRHDDFIVWRQFLDTQQ